MSIRCGDTLLFQTPPVIAAGAAVGGKKEGEGPLAAHFDFLGKDAKLGQKTFEKAESKLQELALDTAKRKLGISYAFPRRSQHAARRFRFWDSTVRAQPWRSHFFWQLRL